MFKLPYNPPNTAISLPRDEGWHTLLVGDLADPRWNKMEWVYANMHLSDDKGHRYVVFIAYFTQGLRVLTVTEFDPDWKYIRRETGTCWGVLTGKAGEFDLAYKHWGGEDSWVALRDGNGELRPGASRVKAEDDASHVAFDMELASTREPYYFADTGYSAFGTHGWYSYYSYTRMEARGEITFAGEAPIKVSGRAWFDHQWGPFFITPFRNPGLFEEYEWFSVQLDDGTDMMLVNVWTPDDEMPQNGAYGGVGVMWPDGTTEYLPGSAKLTRFAYYKDKETDAIYSAGWRLQVPEWECDLTIKPRYAHQMTPMADEAPDFIPSMLSGIFDKAINAAGAFWEGSCGVTGTLRGKQVSGDSFAELIKRYNPPSIALAPPDRSHNGVVLRWRVRNLDPGTVLFYDVVVSDRSGQEVVSKRDLEFSVLPLSGVCEPGKRYKVSVCARSEDGVLSSTASRWFTP